MISTPVPKRPTDERDENKTKKIIANFFHFLFLNITDTNTFLFIFSFSKIN